MSCISCLKDSGGKNIATNFKLYKLYVVWSVLIMHLILSVMTLSDG